MKKLVSIGTILVGVIVCEVGLSVLRNTVAKAARKQRRNSDWIRGKKSKSGYEEIIFANASDAQDVLNNMIEFMEDYGVVSVADLYDLTGIPSNCNDNNYGWKNIDRTFVKRGRDGFVINLSKPIVLL